MRPNSLCKYVGCHENSQADNADKVYDHKYNIPCTQLLSGGVGCVRQVVIVVIHHQSTAQAVGYAYDIMLEHKQ